MEPWMAEWLAQGMMTLVIGVLVIVKGCTTREARRRSR